MSVQWQVQQKPFAFTQYLSSPNFTTTRCSVFLLFQYNTVSHSITRRITLAINDFNNISSQDVTRRHKSIPDTWYYKYQKTVRILVLLIPRYHTTVQVDNFCQQKKKQRTASVSTNRFQRLNLSESSVSIFFSLLEHLASISSFLMSLVSYCVGALIEPLRNSTCFYSTSTEARLLKH